MGKGPLFLFMQDDRGSFSVIILIKRRGGYRPQLCRQSCWMLANVEICQMSAMRSRAFNGFRTVYPSGGGDGEI